MKHSIKNLGIFTSGGDSPGMNAALRAAVMTANRNGLRSIGIMRGYEGMIENEMRELSPDDVKGIAGMGGTIIKTARSKAFMSPEGMNKAFENIEKAGIDALLAIGGDGTFRGASLFANQYNLRVAGVPGTIDNDLFGTDYTLGFDTAVNTAVESVDKIRDTAESHGRLFFVEVMGRDSGMIALHTAVASGADAVLIPEDTRDYDELLEKLRLHLPKARRESFIVIVAEGEDRGAALKIAESVKIEFADYDTRVSILGHVQRGGAPTAFDRILGAKLATAAVEAIIEGKNKVMAGLVNNQIVFTDFANCLKIHPKPDSDLLKISKM